MSNYHIKSSKSQRLNWGNDYEFSNLPITYLSNFEEDDSILSPILDQLLRTPAGEIHVAKVAATLGGTCLIIFLCLVGACIKFPKMRECFKTCLVKMISTQAHKSYLKKKLHRKKKVLQTNLSMLETAQSIDHQELEKAQALSLEMETRKDHSVELEEKACGARKKSRSRSRTSRQCPNGYKTCTCDGIAERCRGYVQ